jgi:thioredoxin-like negative regulator of GroEL
MICPLCAGSVGTEARACPACGADLSEYAAVHYHPDVLFNDALRRLGRGQSAVAAALLAAVTSWRPDDAEALGLWAEAALSRGEPAEAVRILLAAADIAPGPALDDRLAGALAAVEAASGTGTGALVEIAARLRADIGRLETGLAAAGVLDPLDPCEDSELGEPGGPAGDHPAGEGS